MLYFSTDQRMSPLQFKKRMSFSCASPSSTAVCASIEQRSIFQPITRREIDRHTPHLRELQRTKSNLNNKPDYFNQNSSRKSIEKSAELVSSVGSSRYLLNSSRLKLKEAPFIDIFPDTKPFPSLLPFESSKLKRIQSSELAVFRPSSSAREQDQVVVLRVSLHCKGCEGKVRKHISKMQGVRTFSIDLPTKKVTVVGEVTPLGVLNSISKVKNAQFWSSPPRYSASF